MFLNANNNIWMDKKKKEGVILDFEGWFLEHRMSRRAYRVGVFILARRRKLIWGMESDEKIHHNLFRCLILVWLCCNFDYNSYERQNRPTPFCFSHIVIIVNYNILLDCLNSITCLDLNTKLQDVVLWGCQIAPQSGAELDKPETLTDQTWTKMYWNMI